MKKSRQSIVLIFIMIFTIVFTACSKKEEPASSTAADSADKSTPVAAETKAPEAKNVTITFQNIYPDPTTPSFKIMNKIIADYTAANPNVKIELDSLNADQQKIKLKTQAASNEVPDITIVNPAAQMKPFVDGGVLAPLNDMVEQNGLKDTFTSGILDYYSFDNNLYGLPDGNNIAMVYYNKELFEKAGAKVPTTYEEMVEAVTKLKASGVIPMTVAEKDTWTGSFFFMNIVLRTNEGPNFLKDVLDKKKTFNDPSFVLAVKKLEDLQQAGAFEEGSTSIDYTSAANLFKTGKAAMYYMGSWETGGIDDSAVKGKVGVFKFPTVDGKGDPDQFMLAPGSAFAIAAHSKHLQETKDFLNYFMLNFPKVSFEMKNAVGIAQKVDGDFKAAGYSALAMEVLDLFKGVKGGDLAFDNTMNPSTAQVHLNSIQKTFVTKVNPEDVAKEHQAAFEKNSK
jgi:raffinose/stachyose/melibiose transport system substrate-binding protein